MLEGSTSSNPPRLRFAQAARRRVSAAPKPEGVPSAAEDTQHLREIDAGRIVRVMTTLERCADVIAGERSTIVGQLR